MKTLLLKLCLCLLLCGAVHNQLRAQCCAGGSGSPIAGGASQGVLMEHQMELSASYQYVSTHKFLEESTPIRDFLDDFHSSYVYTRVAYGLSEDFTMSVECGTWLTKTQVGLNKGDTVLGSGVGDLIVFPRYTVYRQEEGETSSEITLGMGVKFPLGHFQDSMRVGSTEFFTRKPLAVQTTSGASDVLFYGFFFRSYEDWNLRFFANALYISKGWNSVGEKMGDYASFSLFASTQIVTKLSGIVQLKAEWVDSMKINRDVYDYHNPGYEPQWTGYKKFFVCPQLSYVLAPGFLATAMMDIPLWQQVNGRQIASQWQGSIGLSYRFFIVDNEE